MDKKLMMATYPMIHEPIIDGICRHVNDHKPVGGFLTAVLSNDLKESFGRADANNRIYLYHVVDLLWNHAPSGCWGSPEEMKSWLKK